MMSKVPSKSSMNLSVRGIVFVAHENRGRSAPTLGPMATGNEVLMHAQRTPRRPLSTAQQLRKLQLAVDHIAAVIDDAPAECVADLNDALDAIHHAESAIEDERDA